MAASPIDPDVARAATPDGAFYGEPAFALQRARLFPRTWHLATLRGGELPQGHVQPWTLLPGALDEPLLWTRAGDGRLRCLSNVCTHRGNLLCDDGGSRNALRCGYHGRTFDLDGRMKSAPGFEGAADFPRARDDLPAATVGECAGLHFCALQPAVPFAQWSAPAADLLALLPQPLAPAPSRTRDYEVAANWALYVDNYLEGMHIPYVHRALAQALAVADYEHELAPWSTLQVGVAQPGEPVLELPRGHRLHGRRIAGLYLWLFPCTMLNLYPWGLSANVVEPLAPARARVRYLTWVVRPELQEKGAGGDLDTVEREDQAVVTATQRGVQARLYAGGRYAPRHEAGVHLFHRLLTQLLA
jgi:choline monooxygenase